MGLIKGFLFWIVVVVLFFSLLGFNSLFSVSLSLGYDNVNKNLVPFFSELSLRNSSVSEEVQEIVGPAETHCLSNENYVTDYSGFYVDIDCSLFDEGERAVFDEVMNDVVYDIYYRDYNCGFWKCFETEESPLFFVSEKTQDYWQGKIYIVMLVSLALFGILFFLVEKRLNWFFAAGITIVASALPLLKIKDFFSGIAGFVAPFSGDFLNSLIDIFFSKTSVVFWIIFVLGLAVIGLGVALKFTNIGFVKRILENEKDSDKSEETPKTPRKKK